LSTNTWLPLAYSACHKHKSQVAHNVCDMLSPVCRLPVQHSAVRVLLLPQVGGISCTCFQSTQAFQISYVRLVTLRLPAAKPHSSSCEYSLCAGAECMLSTALL
jgi:hypothetical protein